MCHCVEIGVREKKRKETIESRRIRVDYSDGSVGSEFYADMSVVSGQVGDIPRC